MAWYDILGSIATAGINAYATQELNKQNAKLQHEYWNKQTDKSFTLNEQAADNAMERSLNLYNLTQSPQAMTEQLRKAGLNPAMINSKGGMGGHTQSGPQGGANGAGNISTFGLQQVLDPMTFAQIENINADTRKKESETKLTDSQIKTQELTNEYQQLENDFNLATYGERFQKFKAECASAVEQANIDRINGKIAEETYEEQLELIGQNLLIAKAKEALLKSQKNLTDEQINEILKSIKLMEAQIWKLSSETDLNEEQLTKLVNDREWNYISVTDAKWIAEQTIDVLKELLNLVPVGRVKTFITNIITKREGDKTTVTKTTTQG